MENHKSGKCKICGCTINRPCYNPDWGTCWWINDEENLCSHCYIDEIVNDPQTRHFCKKSEL